MNELQRFQNNESEIPETYHEKSRRLNGIPKSLDKSPVLSLSSHKGVYYELDSFIDSLSTSELEGKMSHYINLSSVPSSEVVQQLNEFIKNHDKSIDPSELLFNIQFYPALDEEGKSSDPAETFAIDPTNYKTILPELIKLLEKKLDSSDEISSNIKAISDEGTIEKDS
jgi:hypothetical protein